ncbi:MAG: DUF3999 domain-containing protein [Burkholderiales bacterium]|jgi:hypothetical protein|nr:DUF3999 domain-containing protein [Burkholderiales bacterium]
MMRRFNFFTFLFFAGMLAATSATAEIALEAGSKTGFRHYFALELEGNASYYLFTFTPEVHQAIMAPGGRDFRIIDAGGNLVPYAFGGSIEAKEEMPKELTLRSLPWFPLPRAQGGKSVRDGFIIAADGALRVRERQIEAEHRSGDIIDLSGIFSEAKGKGDEQSDGRNNPALNALFIHIDASTGEYLGTVEVLASNDLQNWSSVTTAQLLRLDHHGQRLERERVDFDGALLTRLPRYLQLRWRAAPPIIASIEAELLLPQGDAVQVQRERQSELRYWREKLPGQMLPDGQVIFDTGGVFPVDRLRFHLPRPNTVVPVKLYSRADENASWQLICRETLYRLQGPDGVEETPEIRVASNRDRFWSMVVESDGRSAGGTGKGKENNGSKENPEFGGAPLLSVGWRPETVTFLAHGTPPFLIAAGNAQATDASIPLTRLLVGDKPYLAVARVGAVQPTPANAPVVLSGTEAEPENQTLRYILWGVLLAIVALLAFMAWRVAKHLPQEENSKEGDRH